MKQVSLYVIGLVLVAMSFLLDKTAIKLIQLLHNDFLVYILSIITVLGSFLAVTALTTLLFAFNKKNRKNLHVLWITLIIGYLITSLLKTLIARERPETLLIEETGFSFPSGHAVAVFAPIQLIKNYFPELKIYWIILAVLVLLSRLYLGAHYLSDVVAGALTGYIIGNLVLLASKKFKFLRF